MRRLLMATALALVASAALAVADTAKRTDPKGDLKGVPGGGKGFDFRSASVKHDGNRVVHRVVSWNPDPAGFPVVRLEIQTDTRPPADWYVKKTRDGAAIFDNYRDKRIGGAKFIRHSGKSFSFKFSLAPLGNPPYYAWRWRIVGPTRGSSIDLIPNKGFVAHRLPGNFR